MAEPPSEINGTPKRNVSLIVFFVLFALFSANVLLGKGSVEFGWNIPFLLNDVLEFLLLLLGVLFFVRAALAAERTAVEKVELDRSNQQKHA